MTDETTPLARAPECDQETALHSDLERKSNVDRIFFLFAQIGGFFALADESFVLSTHSDIASGFQHLSLGTWLLTAYNLGYSVGLPLYGRVCDIYGYRRSLMIAYSLFSCGCAVSGGAVNIFMAIAGRAISGIGASGMVDVLSVIITDMVPLKEAAVLRSYIITVGFIGSTVGAPLGGILADLIGWRWSILGQSPIGIICFAVATWRLPSRPERKQTGGKEDTSDKRRQELNLFGICLWGTTIATILIICQYFGEELSGDRSLLAILVIFLVVSSLLFGINERFWTRDPLMPVSLLKWKGIGLVYIGQILTEFSFSGLISNITEFFVRTRNVSSGVAGFCLLTIPVAAILGSLLYGHLIGRTGRYKKLAITGTAIALVNFVLIALRWPEGPSFWELAYPFFVSFGIMGLLTTQYVGLSASTPSDLIATTTTGYYLAQQFGIMLGVTLAPAITRRMFREYLVEKLGTTDEALDIIRQVLKDARFAHSLPEQAQSVVRSSFLQSFRVIPIVSLVGLSLVLPIICWLPEWSFE